MNKYIALDLQMFADGAAAPAAEGQATGEGVQAAAAQPERALSREERTKAALERQEKFLKGDQAAADEPAKQETTPQVIPFKDRLKADPALEKGRQGMGFRDRQGTVEELKAGGKPAAGIVPGHRALSAEVRRRPYGPERADAGHP